MERSDTELAGPPASDVSTETLATHMRAAERLTFVLFEVGGHRFAIGLDEMVEIIVAPSVIRVPRGPEALVGLANLRGNILPIVDLARFLGRASAQTEAERLVVICKAPSTTGLAIENVKRIVDIDPAGIETFDGTAGNWHESVVVSGLLRERPGAPVHMVLSIRDLVARMSERGAPPPVLPAVMAPNMMPDQAAPISASRIVIALKIAGERVAVPVSQVQKTIAFPEDVAILPGIDGRLRKFATVDGRSVALVDLAELLGKPAGTDDAGRQVIICQPDATDTDLVAGLIVDSVQEVISIDEDALGPPIEGLNDRLPGRPVEGLIQCDRSQSIVTLLDLSVCVGRFLENLPKADEPDIAEDPVMIDHQSGETDMLAQQVVVFRIGAEEYGVPIAGVREIICLPEQMTRVPKAPAWFEGVVNLRGSVLPVIDLRLRFGLDSVDPPESKQVVVLDTGSAMTGFVVDHIVDVIALPPGCIAPAVREDMASGLPVRQVANLEAQDRMVLLMDLEAILGPNAGSEAAMARAG